MQKKKKLLWIQRVGTEFLNLYFSCVYYSGNIATAVLQGATEMTNTTELIDRKSTHGGSSLDTDRRTEGRAKTEAEEEADDGQDRQKEDGGMQEKKDSLTEESLRMTSWVEVENESASGGANDEISGKEAREGAREEDREEEEEEKEQTRSVEEELAMMEEKWREQCAINETLKQRLADEEERFRVRRSLTESRKFSSVSTDHTRTL